MKKIIFAGITLFVLILFGFKSITLPANNSASNCDPKELKKSFEPLLKPFIADGFKTTKILFKKQAQKKEVEIPLYYGENYRIVFLTSQMPANFDINIYNKANTARKRKLLYSSKDVPKSDVLQFETDQAKAFFIEYDIPVLDTIKSACVSFILGYEEVRE